MEHQIPAVFPLRRGFDFFYGYNCQRQAHNLYPSHLWRNDERHLLNNTIVNKGKLDDGLDPNDENSYNIYHQNDYAPELMHHEAMQFWIVIKIKNFSLLCQSFTALPLQAPKLGRLLQR